MRTTKRFTPSVIRRFRREGRGEGTFDRFESWHQVTRGDPSSRGRSHITFVEKRGRDTLSDFEWVLLFFAIQSGAIDIRTQFPLQLESSAHEMCAYRAGWSNDLFPGVLELAAILNLRVHKVRSEQDSEDWVPSTDLLLTFVLPQGDHSLLAISGKYASDLANQRKKALLNLERTYWLRRDVDWLLITDAQFSLRVALTLRSTFGWAIDTPVSKEERELTASIALGLVGRSRTHILHRIADMVGDLALAQRMFWQAVWFGPLHIDLNASWHPYLPVQFVSKEVFNTFNPITSRRTAWT